MRGCSLQCEVTLWLFTSLLVYCASQEEKMGMRLHLTVEDGAPGWFPACRWGCAGPGGLNRDGSSDAPTVMPSPGETSPSGELPGADREPWHSATHRPVCSELKWLCLTLNKQASSRPLHLLWEQPQGPREQRCAETGHSPLAVPPDRRRQGLMGRPVLRGFLPSPSRSSIMFLVNTASFLGIKIGSLYEAHGNRPLTD